MNYRMIANTLGRALCVEALLMALPLCISVYHHESVAGLLTTVLLLLAVSAMLMLIKPKTGVIYAREGFVIVALSWIMLSLFGAIPFVIEGMIPNYLDAVFEVVSGFTTTGATILTEIEGNAYGLLFWRSFTHWIGGMGVLVFILAVMPLAEERSMHIMRAEVPGPVVGKLVPRMRNTALILYSIYVFLTVLEIVLLMLGGMSLFDAAVHAFGTAGTGGFSVKNASIAYYDSAYIDIVIGVFMALFGINFNLYFLILLGKLRQVFKNEEFRWYVGFIAFATITIGLNITSYYSSFWEALRYSFFQTSSIITTTGFCTANFDLWPEYSRSLLVLLMFVGACAGSTGGALKVSRVILLVKTTLNEIKRMLHPRSITVVKLDGKAVNQSTLNSTLVFFMVYMALTMISILIVSIDGFDFTTSVTGVAACIGNIGPGLSMVGAVGNYSAFSALSKTVLIFDMLLGRLEIFPIIMLFSPSVWKRG